MGIRRLLRATAALFIVGVLVTGPNNLGASPVPTKLQYCTAVCLAASMDCPLSNSAEYCAAFYGGCLNSCLLF